MQVFYHIFRMHNKEHFSIEDHQEQIELFHLNGEYRFCHGLDLITEIFI